MGTSIVDVAKAAGVSHSTVSRVINNRAGVSAEAAKRVRDAMAEMGYVPPLRRPGRKPSGPPGLRTGNVGLVMIGSRATMMDAPIAARVIQEAELSLTERGFNMILCQAGKDRKLPPKIETGRVDGLLLYGGPPDPALRAVLRRHPSVWLLSQRARRGYWGDRVGPDNEAIGRLAAEHLTGQGHKRLAQLTLTGTHLGFETRNEAFEEVAESMGLSVVSIAIEGHTDKNDEIDPAFVDEIVDRLLALDPRPTGLFVPRDRITVVVHHALRARGIDLSGASPDGLSLVSCDNDPILTGLEFAPPTIDIRPDLIAQRAIEQLQLRMQRPSDESRVVVTVEPRLVAGRPSRAHDHDRNGE